MNFPVVTPSNTSVEHHQPLALPRVACSYGTPIAVEDPYQAPQDDEQTVLFPGGMSHGGNNQF